MRRTTLLPTAFLLDHLAGDPEWFPHPVRIIGRAVTIGERILRAPGDSPLREFSTGVMLTSSVVASAYFITLALICSAYKLSYSFGIATESFLAWTCLAARNLKQEAQSVAVALENNDLKSARHRIARIVGRDTYNLDRSEISRALIETLAESTCDGVMAPTIYLAVGGVPLAMAYKAINTLDSMIGHRTKQYFYFGKFAARLDDAVNYFPARITAFCVVVTAGFLPFGDARAASRTWLSDGDRHKSPNAGQSEAAMSGALRVRLGGANYYDGEAIASPVIGSGFRPPTPMKAAQAIRMTSAISIMSLAIGFIFAALQQRRVART